MIEKDDKDTLFEEALQIYTQEVDYYFDMMCSHAHCPIAEEHYTKRHTDAVFRRSEFMNILNRKRGNK